MTHKPTKTKNPFAKIKTRQQLEDYVGNIRNNTVNLTRLTAAKQKEIEAIDAIYNENLAQLAEENKFISEKVSEWALANRDAFGEKKSLVLNHGTIGFRLSPFKLEKLVAGKWDTLVESVKRYLGVDYIRTKEELDKERILADREKLGVTKLAKANLAVDQEETFFVDPHAGDQPA